MLPTIGILVISTAISLFEMPNLLKNNKTKELWVFIILLLIGTSLSIALCLKVNLPNPLDWITFIFKPFSDFIMTTLK
ncbi:hypothetical protein JFL43_02575 [Viridibacillus sp. YIM B01967]|uniref:Uncharacterized protein n=1 Tax=Viridibacillus soli TaxID=2798301 RepID=A0ABS1H384_9BACL|nr:hypothetical protein [Viridibacillus soli]MBK3493761.1 hypothetical protein [Viridibacillus soli]